MARPPPKRHVAFRYMTRFACIGGRCEETCCADWRVFFDQAHYKRLRRAVEGNAVERERFGRAVALHRETDRSAHRFALLRQREDGRCLLLDDDLLCSIQRRHGERLLPDACAIYPRSIGESGDRLELAGTLSCPEVARACLLAEDATDLTEAPPALFGRCVVKHRLSDEDGRLRRCFDNIRGTLYGLLGRAVYPMHSRLLFCLHLAHRIESCLDLKNQAVLDDPRLDHELAALERSEVCDPLHDRARALDMPAARTMEIVVRMLALRLRTTASPSLRRLLLEVLQSYAATGGGVTAAERPGADAADGANEQASVEREGVASGRSNWTISPSRLWQAYAARRQRLLATCGERIDLYFQNYCRNSVIKDWFLGAPTLLLHIQAMVLRVAILRFLLLSHPRAEAAAACEQPCERQRRLDALAVEVFFSFIRTVEHDDRFLLTLAEALWQEMPTLSQSLSLLRF